MNQLAPMVAAAMALAWPLLEHFSRRREENAAGDASGAPTFLDSRALRLTAGLLLLAVLGFNLLADYRLAVNFGSLTISGASAIDGW